MKLKYVALVAIAITVGPVAWGSLIGAIVIYAADHGLPMNAAWPAGVMLLSFPFFFTAVWALTNADSYDRALRRVWK